MTTEGALSMRRLAFFLLFSLCFPWPAAAAEKPLWVEAEGEALLGDVDTPKEVMERVRRDAAAKALEQARGLFLKSHTLVANSQLEEDLIYAAVRGKIDRMEILRAGWHQENRNLYQVRIRASISPVYPEQGEGLAVRLSLSKNRLKEGEEVQLFYQTNRDAYVYLFSIAADGSVTLLLPNAQLPDHFAKGGKAYPFPPDSGPIRLKAMFLPGHAQAVADEKIKIIATREREELLSLGFREGIFQVYDARSTGMISDLVRRLNQLEPTDWAEATAVYTLSR
jgi:hypothetical protein